MENKTAQLTEPGIKIDMRPSPLTVSGQNQVQILQPIFAPSVDLCFKKQIRPSCFAHRDWTLISQSVRMRSDMVKHKSKLQRDCGNGSGFENSGLNRL